MKKLLLMLLATTSLIACTNDKGGENTPPPPPVTDINQTIYADQTEKRDAISFTAPQAWTAVVSDIATRATNGDVEWFQLSAYSGSAGKQSLSISLMPNFTGQSRKVEIVITSGETVITIIVEQKATTEDNKAPQHKTVKRMNSTHNGKSDGYIDFTYDNQQRVISCKTGGDNSGREMSYTITYAASTITALIKNETTINCTYSLDKNGRATSREYLSDGTLMRGSYTYDAEGYLTDFPCGELVEESIPSGPDGSVGDPIITRRIIHMHNVWEGPNVKTSYFDWKHPNEEIANYQYTDKLNNGLASIDLTGGYNKGIELIIFKEGVLGKKGKNLIKRETGTYTRDWSYEFDKDGNMTKFSIACSGNGEEWTESHEIIYN